MQFRSWSDGAQCRVELLGGVQSGSVNGRFGEFTKSGQVDASADHHVYPPVESSRLSWEANLPTRHAKTLPGIQMP
jgi:hypothetical protein